jgi:type III pantothenate kinase
MTAWLFDLGNSRLKVAPLRGGVVGDVHVVDHEAGLFADGWANALPSHFDTAWIASVAAPALTVTVLDTLATRCRRLSAARTQSCFAGVTIAYAEPARLGVDRFLCLLAAHARARQPWLIVGVGTALTIDLLDGHGLHRGGRIAPSPTLMRDSLHRRAPQLPRTGGEYTLFANDTAAALASGCEGAGLALIAQSMQTARELLGTDPALLLHGGGAQALLAHLPGAQSSSALVLEGLAVWARQFESDA